MNQQRHNRHMAQQSGITLIEMMIALTLGLLIVAGLIGMFVTNKKSSDFTKEQIRVQESGRFALNYMRQFFKLAGYGEWFQPLNGIGGTSSTVVIADTSKSSRCAVGSASSADACGTGEFDKLAVAYQLPSHINRNAALGANSVGQVVTCNGFNYPAAAERPIQTITEVFWVNDKNELVCSSQSSAKSGSVPDADDARVIIGGVVDFQVLYGINISSGDLNEPPQNISYVTAEEIAARFDAKEAAERIMAVKIGLLLESEDGIDSGSRRQDQEFYVLDNKRTHSGFIPNLYVTSFKFRNAG